MRVDGADSVSGVAIPVGAGTDNGVAACCWGAAGWGEASGETTESAGFTSSRLVTTGSSWAVSYGHGSEDRVCVEGPPRRCSTPGTACGNQGLAFLIKTRLKK